MQNLTSIRFAQAEDAAALSPAEAARSAWARAEAIVQDAPGRSTWACGRGCAACCHLLVRVHPGEADLIADHVATSFSRVERVELERRLASVAKEASGLGAGAYRHERVRCAFLDAEDGCSIYEARPVLCRVHASRSAEACGDLGVTPPLDTWLSKVGKALHTGLGPDPLEELHQAVADRLGSASG